MMQINAHSLRLTLGKLLFLLPFPLFVLLPIGIPMLGLDSGTSSALIGGSLACMEVLWFLSIPLLGKQGFKQLKQRTFSRLFGYLRKPGPVRHYCGICCFALGFSANAFASLFALWAAEQQNLLDNLLNAQTNTEASLFVSMEYLSFGLFIGGTLLCGPELFVRVLGALKHPAK